MDGSTRASMLIQPGLSGSKAQFYPTVAATCFPETYVLYRTNQVDQPREWLQLNSHLQHLESTPQTTT